MSNQVKLLEEYKDFLHFKASSYEKKGFISDVVFPTGAVLTKDKKSILLYCGGADTVITVKKLNLNEVLNSLDYKNLWKL